MITTNNIKLTSKLYFKILNYIFFKRKWWLFAWIWLIALAFLALDYNDSFDIFVVFLAILLPIAIIIHFWRYANSKDNKVFMLERYYEIYNDRIIGFLSDGTASPIKSEHFIKVIQTNKYYLMYIAKSQFIYLPKDAFKSSIDKDWFDNEIITKIKK